MQIYAQWIDGYSESEERTKRKKKLRQQWRILRPRRKHRHLNSGGTWHSEFHYDRSFRQVNFDYFPFIRWTESSNTPVARKHRFPIASHTIFNLITTVAIDCRWMLNTEYLCCLRAVDLWIDTARRSKMKIDLCVTELWKMRTGERTPIHIHGDWWWFLFCDNMNWVFCRAHFTAL